MFYNDIMDKKKQIEELYIDALNNDEAPNVFADQILFLFDVSNLTDKTERPSPYKWIKEEKFKISEGTSYISPKVNLIQCANWISEYVKKHCG